MESHPRNGTAEGRFLAVARLPPQTRHVIYLAAMNVRRVIEELCKERRAVEEPVRQLAEAYLSLQLRTHYAELLRKYSPERVSSFLKELAKLVADMPLDFRGDMLLWSRDDPPRLPD